MKKNQPVDMMALRLKAKKHAVETYSASLMSNTKWRTLFGALEASAVEVNDLSVKFIGDDYEYSPVNPGLYPPYAYVDLWPLNVYPLVEIEWIEFRRVVARKRPNNDPTEIVTQDIDAIRAVIERTGKRLPLEISNDSIRVVGHVPNPIQADGRNI